MAGRRPQPVTEATNPAPQTPFEMPSLMSSLMGPAVMPHPPAPIQPQQIPMQQANFGAPTSMGGGYAAYNAMGGNGTPPADGPAVMSTGMPMMRPMPQQYGGPRVTNGKNGGYRPQPFNPDVIRFGGGGFGGGCGQ